MLSSRNDFPFPVLSLFQEKEDEEPFALDLSEVMMMMIITFLLIHT